VEQRIHLPHYTEIGTVSLLTSSRYISTTQSLVFPDFTSLSFSHHYTTESSLTPTLFCSLAVLDPRVGHTMDVLSPFISVLYHSDWLFHEESCPRIDVFHPGRVAFLSCVHLALSLSPGNCLVSLWCDHSMLAFLLLQCLTALSRTHSFVVFAVHESCRMFLSPFISNVPKSIQLLSGT